MVLVHKLSNIKGHSHNTVRYGDKSLTKLGPIIWNCLPEEVTAETDFSNFKNFIINVLCQHANATSVYLRRKANLS